MLIWSARTLKKGVLRPVPLLPDVLVETVRIQDSGEVARGNSVF